MLLSNRSQGKAWFTRLVFIDLVRGKLLSTASDWTPEYIRQAWWQSDTEVGYIDQRHKRHFLSVLNTINRM